MESNVCKFNITQSSDLVCSRFVYETKHSQSDPTTSEYYLLGLVLSGEGALVAGDHSHALCEGSLFAVERGTRFAVSGNAALTYSYICYSGRRATELAERVGVSAGNAVFAGYAHLKDFWLACLNGADERNIDLLAESVLLYSLAHLKPAQREQNDVVTRMVMLANDNFTNAAFSLSSLAQQLGYDAKYLSFLFKKKKGVPFVQYLRNLRVKHAIFLMEQGVVSVKNIAILSGFEDALYFSKIFKQSEGLSPKAYIENVQAKM